MSFVMAAPEMLASAATDVARIGSSLRAANEAAAVSTTAVTVAAGDEVSAAITSVFSHHAQHFQALSAQAAAFHDQFVQTLRSGAASYASTEAANASPMLQQVLRDVQVTQAGSWGQTLENRPVLRGSAFNNIFGSPATPPVPATLNPTFTGVPSLANRIEVAGLWAFKEVTGVFGLDLTTQLGPLGAELAAAHIPVLSPLISVFISNTPPKFLPFLFGETVQQTTFDGMSVVQITPAHPSGHYVVALHGGGFVIPASLFHWFDYTLMAHQTGATIEVPIYPLVQQGGTAGTVVPEIAGLLSMEIAQHGAPNVSVYGDSAGGQLALASVEYMVANNETVPASMVLLAPWLAPGVTNPNIAFVHDPLLNAGPLEQVGKEWAGNLPVTDPLVSPLYGSLKGLPPTYVYSGSLDSLGPDVVVLDQEAATQGAPISFVLHTGEIHDWVLLSPDGFKYLPQIYQELGI